MFLKSTSSKSFCIPSWPWQSTLLHIDKDPIVLHVCQRMGHVCEKDMVHIHTIKTKSHVLHWIICILSKPTFVFQGMKNT
jgi:hypothetical protein